jgi:preprotein translocase subunit SecG
MLYTFTIIVIAIICVLLIIIILLQSGQGAGLSGGIAGNAGGGAGNMLGARRTADFLSKSTSILGGVFLTLCLLANFVIDRDATQGSAIQRGGFDQPIQDRFELPIETPPAIPAEPSNDND